MGSLFLNRPELQRGAVEWSGNNRAKWHDYRAKCIYHITLMKDPGSEYFGQLGGDSDILPGNPGSPYLIASHTGKCIKEALRRLPEIHPALHLFQYALMPDHLHLLISVESELDEILGRKLAIFKVMTNRIAHKEQIFQKGFNDQIIRANRKLDTIYKYLRENPYRLAIRRAHPDLFRRVKTLNIDGNVFSAYGNIHLLDNPFKDQVIVHRADDDRTFLSNRDRWLYTAANGGVLVSPFISQREKSIRKEAESLGGRIIQIINHPLGEREKPSGNDFALCVQGRLLIIAPSVPAELDRSCCLAMNALAQTLSST